ncbi:hypothetical protein FJZ36_09425 [Candidatus Poribacteria bacterium]|nr:hypothetical protein [Candidatus Poribacteria bacterium]
MPRVAPQREVAVLPSPTEPRATTPTPEPTTADEAVSAEPVEKFEEEEPVLISSSWVGDSIQNVIGDLALEHNLQIFVSELVRGSVTVQVEEMPLERFLDYVTAPLGADL